MTEEPHAQVIPVSEWQPTVSGDAELKLSVVPAGKGSALQMDFDFKGGGGFVVARRAVSRAMPEEYALRFRWRGRGAVNHFEVKLIDASGQNVWRYVQKNLRLPARWTRMRVESHEIDFAWGPSSGRGIAQLGAIEFAIVAGEGGQGTVWIADVVVEDGISTDPPRANASSEQPGFTAAGALVGSGWRPMPDDGQPWIVIDALRLRTFGGLTIDWLDAAPAGGFRVSASNTGHRWKPLHATTRAGGNRSNVYLPGLKTRFLRLELTEPTAGAALRLQSFDFSRSVPAFWYHIVDAEARGWHPRWLHREQSLWTPIGIEDGEHCALMNADGMVEVAQGSFSLEPILRVGERLFTWSDVDARTELAGEWMPEPTVNWQTDTWRFRIRAEPTVSGDVRVHYRFEWRTDADLPVRLFVLVRPFQVTPPWQSFRSLGGVSPIHDLAWSGGAVRVNDILIAPLTPPVGFGCMRFDDGFIAAHLGAGKLPPDTQVHDPLGYATGALEFDLSPGAEPPRAELPGAVPIRAVLPRAVLPRAARSSERVVSCTPLAKARAADEPAFDWSRRLPVGQWAGTGWIRDVILAGLTATAHILVTRRGPALQPGPRRYTRSWIRDGTMMSAALLRMGHADAVRDFIRWYAPHQRADGFVPCCVDSEGIDWLVEHDSHGQLLALIGDYHRFTADQRLLEDSWSFVDRAVGCIERLLGADGLLPISVSHEGYLAQPVHSYWDNFWALRGLRDAAYLARALRRHDVGARWEALAARFAQSLFGSIETTRTLRKLDFIPGSIEWADFDPTATANAIYLLDVPDGLNRVAVEHTFDKYLADWRGRRNGTVPWQNYTPYEIRIIGALVRLGRRDAALELLRFFLSDRRTPPWNQWPEIAWRDPMAPAHLGDLPHTWIGAEYVLAIRSLFAYERETDQSLVLAAGLAPEWIAGAGVTVTAMPTLQGSLSYSLRNVNSTLRFEIGSGIAGQVVLRPPLAAPLRRVMVDGRAWTGFDDDSVTLPRTPAEVLCSTS